MRSALADRRYSPARALGVALVVLSFVVTGCSQDTSIPPPVAPSVTSAARVSEALETIAALDTALRAGDVAAASALGLAGSRALLGVAASNVTGLHLVDVSLRYVQELTSTTVAGTDEFGPDSWQATIGVQYRLRDWDEEPTQVETTFTFAPGTGTQLIAGIGSADGRTPLWLSGPVKPVVSGRTLVLSRGTSGPRESRLARTAIADVGRVIPSWKGRLVIEAAASEEEFDRVLGTSRAQYANIAAVTASVDGSTTGNAPLHVFLNPALFDELGPRAAQIVISHETTHVATKAPYTENMPTWLVEGFADYVALAHAGVGVQKAAAQVLKRIREEGLPDALPSNDDLAPTAPGLGAAYEEAWLVNRFIACAYGEARLIAFYNAIDRGANTDAAFDSVLKTTQARFVKAWRQDLKALAGRVSGG